MPSELLCSEGDPRRCRQSVRLVFVRQNASAEVPMPWSIGSCKICTELPFSEEPWGISTGHEQVAKRCRLLSNAIAQHWTAVCPAERLATHCSAADQHMLSVMLQALTLDGVHKIVQAFNTN